MHKRRKWRKIEIVTRSLLRDGTLEYKRYYWPARNWFIRLPTVSIAWQRPQEWMGVIINKGGLLRDSKEVFINMLIAGSIMIIVPALSGLAGGNTLSKISREMKMLFELPSTCQIINLAGIFSAFITEGHKHRRTKQVMYNAHVEYRSGEIAAYIRNMVFGATCWFVQHRLQLTFRYDDSTIRLIAWWVNYWRILFMYDL